MNFPRPEPTRPAAAGSPFADDCPAADRPAIVCFSHLRWDFVYQRPQHLLTRFARRHRVYYVEEPIPTDRPQPWLDQRAVAPGVLVVVPRLPAGAGDRAERDQRELLDALLRAEGVRDMVLWYYTPMSLAYSDHLDAALVVYDCMDELSAFRGAPPQLVERERQLLARADVVFTGGYSLYEAKRALHADVHACPSSVDVTHFLQARLGPDDPPDQAGIPHPRLGFYGVLDERFDTALVAELARRQPDWQIVLVGPVVKIDPATLPQAPNIHYLGPKPYALLPDYLGGWDVAIMPFALNESTRYISPTKTPEYLAGGRPVVSTPIVDVARLYGHTPLVRIADGAQAFAAAVQGALTDARDPERLARQADAVLGSMSWDRTWDTMRQALERAHARRRPVPAATTGESLDLAPGAAPAVRGARYDYLIVGAGFAGSVLAERLAAGLGKRVLLIDKRPHIGGNAYDHYNDDGILVHRYGPHIFHTNSDKVVQYLSRFTRWRPYEHRVLAEVDRMLVPMPINLTTLSRLYGRDFTPEQAQAFLASRAEPVDDIRTSEDVVVSQIGRELYEKFFRGYTRKQWGLDPSELDRSVTARIPIRTTDDDRYFADTFQQMPLHGYTRLFENMLDQPGIDIMLEADFRDVRKEVRYDRLIYTGPIDQYFDYRYGPLPYRSLKFRHQTVSTRRHQPAAVVNYPSEAVPYTRITEYKYLTGQRHDKTAITYEYPCAQGDPYYPVPRPQNAQLYRRYQELADAVPEVLFVGRLATYRYYNMDQVVAQALSAYARITGGARTAPPTAAVQQAAA